MAGCRCAARIGLGLVAMALATGPLAAAALAQDDGEEQPPPDPAAVVEALEFYSTELFSADIDGDGVPDVTDEDGDGVPEIPEGEPGERDITPADPLFMQPITSDLQAQGLNTIVENDSGSELVGNCGGMAMSFDADGAMIDWALGIPSAEGGGPSGQLVDIFGDGFGERAFTAANPFQVEDLVIYFGTLPRDGEGPIEHNWTIKTQGISLDSGGDPNPRGKNRNAGEVDVGSVPSWLRPAGIFPVEGNLTSQNNLSCLADGWVEFTTDNPLLTVPSAVAAALGITGFIGLLFNSRPAITWRG